jgi:hypothetical protein
MIVIASIVIALIGTVLCGFDFGARLEEIFMGKIFMGKNSWRKSALC